MIAAAIAATLVLALVPVAPAVANQHRSDRQVGLLANDMLERINDECAERGLHALEWAPDLARAAADWSAEMADSGTFGHSDLGALARRSPFDDRYSGIGENVARQQSSNPEYLYVARSHVRLMASDGHRRNLLNRGYDSVGIGVTCTGEWLHVTQLFARYDDESRNADPRGYDRDTSGRARCP